MRCRVLPPWLLCLAATLGLAWLGGDPRAGPGAGASSADEPPIERRVYLPWALQPFEPRLATLAAVAARTRAAATLTARAQTTATATATSTPSATNTADPTHTPTAHAVPPTPTGTQPAATLMPTVTPSPAFVPRDPALDSLRPRSALRAAAPEVRWEPGRQAYTMRGAGNGFDQVYELALNHPDVRRGRVAIREATSGRYPLAGAGLYYRRSDGQLVAPRDFDPSWPVESVAHALEAEPAGARVVLTVTERLEGLPHAKRYELAPVGGALRVTMRSLDGPGVASGRYAGAGGSWIEGAQEAVAIRIPFMEAVPVTLLDGRWFASTLIDLPRSNAGEILPRGPESDGGAFVNESTALYPANAAGTVSAISETLWVTLSAAVDDVFAEPPGPVAPYRAALASAIHVRLGRGNPAATADDKADYLARLAGWGMTDLIVHDDGWSDAGVPPPALAPDAAAGGPDGARRLASAGRVAPMVGYTMTVAGCSGEPNAAYRAGDRVVGADGQAVSAGAWPCSDGEAAAAWLLAPEGALRAAGPHAATLAQLGAAGITLGDVGSWSPAWPWPGAMDSVVDRGAASQHAATVGAAITAYGRLFQFLQTAVGPVFGDGAPELVPELRHDAFYAGYLDGYSPVLAGPRGDGGGPGAHGLVMPDYALTAIRPRAVAYGFGPLGRFFGRTDGVRMSDAELDRYRALLLAYGHAAAFEANAATGEGSALSYAQAVSLYHLMRPVQAALFAADGVTVAYVGSDGRRRDLTRALIDGIDFSGPRLVLEATGAADLTLRINLSDNVWQVEAASGTWLLPADGWLVEGPGMAGFSALVDGRRVDRMVAPSIRLLDGRGALSNVAGETARDLRIRFDDGRVLEELPDGTLRWQTP